MSAPSSRPRGPSAGGRVGPRRTWRRPLAPKRDPPARTGRLTRGFAVVGVLITTTAGALGLLFTVAPNLKPCLGESSARFTGAPVIPGVSFRDHLVRTGVSRQVASHAPNPLGAEVRFSYQATGLRHTRLRIMYSLVAIEQDGTLGRVDPTQDRALAMTVTPSSCGESGGDDIFLQIRAHHRRYRAILELYRDAKTQLTDRFDLLETAPFRG